MHAAINIKLTNICACRKLVPLSVRSQRAIGSANVLGMTTESQAIDKADGKSCNPTTSAHTGATVVVKVAATGLQIRA